MVSSAAGCRVEIEAEIEARREVRSVAAMQIELQSSRDEVERLSDLLAEQVRIAIVSTAGRSKYSRSKYSRDHLTKQALQLQHDHGVAAAAAHAQHSEQQELRPTY